MHTLDRRRDDHRAFRIVTAQHLRTHFSSDRSHMRGGDGEGWLAPPPPWPCIGGPTPSTLPAYLDLAKDLGPGTRVVRDWDLADMPKHLRTVQEEGSAAGSPPR